MNVLDGHRKNARVAIGRHRNGQLIRRCTESRVEAQDAAAALGKERIVGEENRKAGRGDAADQLSKLQLEVGDADFTNPRAGAGYGLSEELGHSKGDGRINMGRILQ